MITVDIAMATYNGACYLEQQLDSIIAQSHSNWRLFIRDDNSSDRTVDIIKRYAQNDSRIFLIEDQLGSLRVSRNFETAISYCTAQYTMLADQDDVWSSSKIERSLAYIIAKEDGFSPVLVYTNSMLTNSDLSIEFGPNYRYKSRPCFEEFIFYKAGYQGATMIFNSSLRDKLFPFLERSKVHDFHISLVGLLQGKVYFLNESTMLYRRHQSTTTVSNYTIIQRFKSLMKGCASLSDPEMTNYLERFVADRSIYLSDNCKELVKAYFNIVNPGKSLISKIKIVRKYGFTLRNSSLYLICKLFVNRL